MSKERVKEEIHQYGDDVLHSDRFREALRQRHHLSSSVGEHTLRVTATSLRLSHALEHIGVYSDTKSIVRGALCHDLGILGREQKYRSSRHCCVQHPKDSVSVAKEFYPELDEKTEKIIRRHMWPLGGKAPRSREEVIVSLSDKYASVKDLLYGVYRGVVRHRNGERHR